MPTSWLTATKVSPPARRRDALSRGRLLHLVAEGLQRCRITLISAPAGAGKTSLLAELPHALPHTRWAWLLLDADDNDPTRVAAALAASFASANIVPGAIPPGSPPISTSFSPPATTSRFPSPAAGPAAS